MFMKKYLLLAGVFVLLIPLFAGAAVFKTDENISAGTTISDNVYLVGGNPVIAGHIDGDLFVAGGNVNIMGSVSNDVAAAGGNIAVTGEVTGDVRVFGGSIYIDGTVGGEVISFGGQVVFGPNASVQKDLTGGGGQVKIDPLAAIGGIKRIFVDEETGKVIEKQAAGLLTGAYLAGVIYTLIAYLIVAAIILGLFPNVAKRFTKSALKDGASFWKYLGIGFLVLVLTPILAMTLFMTVFGAMAGGILLLLYITYIIVNLAMAGILFGTLMKKWFAKVKGTKNGKNGKDEPDFVWGLGGVAVLYLICQIPFIGWLIVFVFFLFSLGALTMGDWRIYREAKA
jgi:hypothetical protein